MTWRIVSKFGSRRDRIADTGIGNCLDDSNCCNIDKEFADDIALRDVKPFLILTLLDSNWPRASSAVIPIGSGADLSTYSP